MQSTTAETLAKAPAAGIPTGVIAVGEHHHGNGSGAGHDGGGADLGALLVALQAMKMGDFSVRLPGDLGGAMGKIASTFNEIVASNQQMSQQLERVGDAVGREGRTRSRVKLGLSAGAWGDMETSVNMMIE